MFNVNDILNAALNNATESEISEMLNKFKLNWKVGTLPLSLPSGKVSQYMGLTRLDNEEVFGTCKDGYEVFQNDQLADLVIRIGEKTGYEIHNGGMFKKGAHVYLQLKTGQVNGIGQNNDSIMKFATAVNSHNGTLSLGWGHSNITISCQNTFFAASKQLKNKARHTKSLQSVIDQSLTDLKHVQAVEKSIFDKYFQFAETPVTQDKIKEVVKSITEIDISLNAEQMKKEYSTYSINRMHELVQCIAAEQRQKGNTIWGLFSGVTKYTSHVLTVPNRDNARQESKLIGTAQKIDNETFALLSA